MAKGLKTGGRTKGSRNKKLTDIDIFVARIEQEMDLGQVGIDLLKCGQAATIAKVWQIVLEYKLGKPVQPIVEPEADEIFFGELPVAPKEELPQVN